MKESNDISVNVRTLVEFLLRNGDITAGDSFMSPERAQKGSEIHREIQKRAKEKYSDYVSEKTLSARFERSGILLTIEGRCDGFRVSDNVLYVDEIKTVMNIEKKNFAPNTVHISQALCYAAMLSDMPEYSCKNICIRVLYRGIKDSKCAETRTLLTKDDVTYIFGLLADEYFKWIAVYSDRNSMLRKELETLSFPFGGYRKGQRELAVCVYKTITEYEGAGLYAAAPTGIGKTVSVLFPSLKAMCREISGKDISKIFYFTAANSGAASPEKASSVLSEQLRSMQSISLSSKEKICAGPLAECSPETCPRAKGHYDRVNECIYEACKEGGMFTKDRISELAQKYNVCPFELQLDISLFCDLIIGDYNYLFDPSARLRRFFGEFKNTLSKQSERLKYIFLIDEAHNLPSRAREMYSASLRENDIRKFRDILPTDSRKYSSAAEKIGLILERLGDIARSAASGQLSELSPDGILADRCIGFCETASRMLTNSVVNKKIRKEFLNMYFVIKSFYETSQRFDKNYRAYYDSEDDAYTLYCVEPSDILHTVSSCAAASVFFSGTMQPFGFCVRSLGADMSRDRFIKVPSPFPPENRLCIVSADVSTLYSRRSEYYSSVVRYIYMIKDFADHSCGGKGNFMFFFSSYKYMDDILEMLDDDFKSRYVRTQPRSAGNTERDEFISSFVENPDKIHIGMCVLGSVFSEGIDLPGSRLSGAVIVGVGLPGISRRRDMISELNNERQPGSGFLNAYLYPGMNKVLQAAGRVIRTCDDRGFVIFLDSRYFTKNYEGLFPEDYIVNKARNFDEVRALLFDLKL